MAHLRCKIRLGVMVGFISRGLWRGAAERWVDGALELCHGVAIVLGDLGARIIDVATAEVDESRGIRDILTSSLFFDEEDNILFYLAILQRETNFLARLYSSQY